MFALYSFLSKIQDLDISDRVMTVTHIALQACSDLCRGEYTAQTDSIKSLFSCAVYTAPTLACIALGIGEEKIRHKKQTEKIEFLKTTQGKVPFKV